MLEGSRVEVRLEVVIHGELADVFVHDIGAALHGTVVGNGAVVTACSDALKRQVAFGVAQVLTELPYIVKAVFEGVAECVVGLVVELPLRVTRVLVILHLARR